jgi:hypothetical protein
MQTRTYGELFNLIQSLAGVRAFAPSEQDDIANFINRRFSEIYNESPFLMNHAPEPSIKSFRLPRIPLSSRERELEKPTATTQRG